MDSPKPGNRSIIWPALPKPNAAMRLAVLQQIEANQWNSPEAIRRGQFLQLNALLRHAAATVPFYADRLRAAGLGLERPVTPEDWLRMPLLSRGDIQKNRQAMLTSALPASHGKTSTNSTSGSTGMPVTVHGTSITALFWEIATLREHLWHGRDLKQSMAVIRRIPGGKAAYPEGLALKEWGGPISSVFENGPLFALEIDASVAQQVEWLSRIDPAYLRSYPTNLLALARHCDRHGVKLPNLQQCLTFGELVHPQVREACREVWGAGVFDTYSSQEVGYISLQAPGHEHQLVQSDFVLVEVLDRDGLPCRPGEVGRVVVTALHNYYMPLLRYDIGDFAEVGGPCPTGRGLPVLTRILGRERNMLVDRDGNEYWPAFGVKSMTKLAPIRQFQLAQVAVDKVEARLVPERPLTAEEQLEVQRHLTERLPGSMIVELALLEDIPRSKGGKYEDFVNEVRR